MRNFFEHQDQARRSTRLLLGLMSLGVLAMGLSVFALLELMVSVRPELDTGRLTLPLLGGSVFGTAALVAVASGVRVLSLRGGGAQIAEMLGGRLVSGAPRDFLDKRLLNVVEEMALAAGLPVPLVFVLDEEPGINAFAAGDSLADAAIAVTRGCLEKLTREELQGVVAHELSHVLHGDMRLNTRLMGIVFGIVCIGLLGRLLLRFGTSGARRVGRRREGAAASAGLLMLGVGVVVIGAIGELFGKAIKAAVSRQREYLADASAVQFTRNPGGLAGALKKIGGFSEGASMRASHAEEASHFFFGDIHRSFFGGGGWLATHPPLAERIGRLEPGFGGAFPEVADRVAEPFDEGAAGLVAGAPPTHAPLPAPRVSVQQLLARMGTVGAAQVDRAAELLRALPSALSAASGAPFSAVALVYAMLLSERAEVLARQCAEVRELSNPALEREMLRLRPHCDPLRRDLRLPLLQLTLPSLRLLSTSQRAAFLRTVEALTEADQEISLFERVLRETLRLRVVEHDVTLRRTRRRHATLLGVSAELELLLSLLAHAGAVEERAAQRAFAAAARRLPRLALSLLPRSERLAKGLGSALLALHGLAPRHLESVLDAAAHALLSDEIVTEDELTLLHAVCDALACPLPLDVEVATPA